MKENNPFAREMTERANNWDLSATRKERLIQKALARGYPSVAKHLSDVARSFRIIATRHREDAERLS